MADGTLPGSATSYRGPSPSGRGSATPIPDALLNTFHLPLSFGEGLPGTDDSLPFDDGDPLVFWLSPTLDADHALQGPNQPHEWPTNNNLGFLGVLVFVDAASLTDGGGQLIVTVDHVDTGVGISIPAGITTDTLFTGGGPVAVAAGSRIGLRWAPDDTLSAGTLRCEAQIEGQWTGTAPTPAVAVLSLLPENLVNTGGKVLSWADAAALHQDLDLSVAGVEPNYIASAINGFPAASWPAWPLGATQATPLYRATNLKKTSVTEFASGDPRTIYTVMIPKLRESGQNEWAGLICSFRAPFTAGQTPFTAYAKNHHGGAEFIVMDNTQGVFLKYPAALATDFDDSPVIVKQVYDGTNLAVYVNGVFLTLVDEFNVPSTAANPADTSSISGYFLGGTDPTSFAAFAGYICQHEVFAAVLTPIETLVYESALSVKFGIPL